MNEAGPASEGRQRRMVMAAIVARDLADNVRDDETLRTAAELAADQQDVHPVDVLMTMRQLRPERRRGTGSGQVAA